VAGTVVVTGGDSVDVVGVEVAAATVVVDGGVADGVVVVAGGAELVEAVAPGVPVVVLGRVVVGVVVTARVASGAVSAGGRLSWSAPQAIARSATIRSQAGLCIGEPYWWEGDPHRGSPLGCRT
jgi:hypothetical protein